MTKKKALKMIMAWGVQRNEAQKRLLNLHKLGLPNQTAVFLIRFSTGFVTAEKARRLCGVFDYVCTAAEQCAKSVHVMADEVEAWKYEDSGN